MRDYRLRGVVPEDEAALTQLFDIVFGVQRSSAEWRWKFLESRGLLGKVVAAGSMVALDSDGAIVAHAGAVTLPGCFRGKATPFVQICDVMVHPRHRGGLGRNNLFTILLRGLLSKIAADLPSSFRYGFPGRGPYLVGRRAGVYQLMEIARKMEVSPNRRRSVLWRVGVLDWVDVRLDRVWSDLGGSFELGLVRDGAYLRWRYANNPVRDYDLLGVWRFGRLQGWVVACLEQGELRLVDMMLPIALIAEALGAVARHAAEVGGQSSAVLWLPEPWRSRSGLAGSETPVYVANMCWQASIDTATARKGLFYTMGDVDIF